MLTTKYYVQHSNVVQTIKLVGSELCQYSNGFSASKFKLNSLFWCGCV
jgi:hypothetical protein